MFSLIKQVFIVLINFSRSLACIVNASDCTKCISLNNRACMSRSTFIGLNPLSYYPFPVNFDRCIKSCNTRNYLSNRVCVLNLRRYDKIKTCQ